MSRHNEGRRIDLVSATPRTPPPSRMRWSIGRRKGKGPSDHALIVIYLGPIRDQLARM
jgi:hypothetical protein